ncbi:hypothetical protein [Rhodoferax sp.]|uniref:hypothetical protein n=1 Tax=Rhodoferax sp. TaxID=50421 RepID=UPI002ACD8FC2|nr:hypothetical protein [Rhodoferax sp.]MDZ7920368.1 hypothetical protein [Rhodoferax sp.]
MIQILLLVIDSVLRTQRPANGIEGAFQVRLIDGLDFREGCAFKKYLVKQWCITPFEIIQLLI